MFVCVCVCLCVCKGLYGFPVFISAHHCSVSIFVWTWLHNLIFFIHDTETLDVVHSTVKV